MTDPSMWQHIVANSIESAGLDEIVEFGDREGDDWLKIAALLGIEAARVTMGRQVLDRGGKTAEVEAYAWFWLAYGTRATWEDSNEVAEVRELASKLNRTDILAAKRLAYAWKASINVQESGKEGEAPWRYHSEGHRIWHTLEEARRHPQVAVVFEGDYGGQVYLTCPLHLVACDQAELAQLVEDVDSFFWTSGGRFYFDNSPPGSDVWGGMGGGSILESQLWLHSEVEAAGLRDEIWSVLSGQKPLMDMGLKSK